MSLAFCVYVSVWRDVFISVYSMGVSVCHLSVPSVRGMGGFTPWLQAGFTGTDSGAVAVQKLSHWLPPFVHTSATKSKTSFTLTGGRLKTCGFVRWGEQNQAFSKTAYS